ncbi:MAG: hypothetical protein HQ446_03125 [Polaromonas sp.]|nr:hypothetical protein [Polaromonas sp.]
MFESLYVVLDRATVFDGARQAEFARMRGRRVLSAGVCPVDELATMASSTLRVSVVSPMNFCQRMALDAFRRKLVPFVARRQLEQEGIFADRFRLKTEVISVREGKAEAYVVACLEDDAQMAMESLPVHERPLLRLAVPESAVAALVGRVTAEPVLVLWYRAGLLTCLGVSRSRVVWQRAQRVEHDSFIALDHWRAVVERAVAGAPLEFVAGQGLRVNLGNGPWAQEGAWATNGSQSLVDRIGKIFTCVPVESVLRAPELYGLAFVPSAANLVMNGYGNQVRAWTWGRPLAAIAAVCGLALGGGGWLSTASAERTENLAVAMAEPLDARYAEVQASMPSAAAVKELQSALDLNDVLSGGMRVDQLLARLTRMAQPNVRLKRIDIARATAARTRPARAQPAGAARNNDFVVNLDFSIAGSFTESKLSAEQLVVSLAELGTLEGTRFDHVLDQSRRDAPRANFSTRIVLNTKTFP